MLPRGYRQGIRRGAPAISDETMTRLAEDYEKGALLDFYFADQFREVEVSGFDVASFVGDMVAGLIQCAKANASRILLTPAPARSPPAKPIRHTQCADRSRRRRPRCGRHFTQFGPDQEPQRNRKRCLQTRNYEQAETRLKALLQENPGDARLLFTLGQTASLWARDTTDDDLQSQRLNRALANYRLATQAPRRKPTKALLSRAHEAMGRIPRVPRTQRRSDERIRSRLRRLTRTCGRKH